MRLLPLIASAIVTTALVFTLNIQLKIGNAKAPKLGFRIQHG